MNRHVSAIRIKILQYFILLHHAMIWRMLYSLHISDYITWKVDMLVVIYGINICFPYTIVIQDVLYYSGKHHIAIKILFITDNKC